MFWSTTRLSYRKILRMDDHLDESEGDYDSAEKALIPSPSSLRPNVKNQWPLSRILHWISHGFLVIILIIWLWSERINSVSRSHSKSAVWSPTLGFISESPIPIQFDGSFYHSQSKYFGAPTPERIRAWNQLGNAPLLNISREQMIRMDKSLNSSQYADGGGYIGILEADHFIHCVHSLWEDHYLAKDPYVFGPEIKALVEKVPDDVTEKHFNHCIDMIRQKLMCDPDLGVLTFSWVEGSTIPKPDFSSVHSCKGANHANRAISDGWSGGESPFQGFEALHRWAEYEKVVVPLILPDEWVVPEDAVILAEAP